MKTNIQIFNSPEFGEIRTMTMPDGQIGFVGNSVAQALGYVNYRNAILKHVDEDDKLRTKIEYAGQMREVTIISESGLYSLVLSSKLPTARKFKCWVTSEVLPAIRQTGAYMTPDTLMQVMQQPESILTICKKLIELNEENKRLAPHAEYAEKVLESPTCYTMTQIAKSLSMTVLELQQKLENKHIIYRSPSGPFMLYAPYLKQGYEKYRTRTGENSYGEVQWTSTYLVWTEKGRKFINEMLNCA